MVYAISVAKYMYIASFAAEAVADFSPEAEDSKQCRQPVNQAACVVL
jgi:hypothetical protein